MTTEATTTDEYTDNLIAKIRGDMDELQLHMHNLECSLAMERLLQDLGFTFSWAAVSAGEMPPPAISRIEKFTGRSAYRHIVSIKLNGVEARLPTPISSEEWAEKYATLRTETDED